jgi:hypothetical protein
MSINFNIKPREVWMDFASVCKKRTIIVSVAGLFALQFAETGCTGRCEMEIRCESGYTSEMLVTEKGVSRDDCLKNKCAEQTFEDCECTADWKLGGP